MIYQLRIKRSAEKEMQALPKDALRRIHRKILALAENPLGPGAKKLVGGLGYRLRVGPHRIIFNVDEADKVVEVVAIRHRREAYR